MQKKLLLFIDILGFGKRATEIASVKGIDVNDVRDKMIEVITGRVEAVEKEGLISGKKYGQSDDWLLVADDMAKAYRSIGRIMDHHCGYGGYEEIPLEIAVGTAEYGKWAVLDGTKLVTQDATIGLLKTNLIGHYHQTYRQKYGASPKVTFVVLTEPAYYELEPYDRDDCVAMDSANAGIKVGFYSADVDRIRRRGKLYDFLEKIDRPYSRFYHRIDELFVPPVEYPDIQASLQKNKVVFITGPQEYGKTYTAVRLMWEYYNGSSTQIPVFQIGV